MSWSSSRRGTPYGVGVTKPRRCGSVTCLGIADQSWKDTGGGRWWMIENDTWTMDRCQVTSGLEPYAESHCEPLVGWGGGVESWVTLGSLLNLCGSQLPIWIRASNRTAVMRNAHCVGGVEQSERMACVDTSWPALLTHDFCTRVNAVTAGTDLISIWEGSCMLTESLLFGIYQVSPEDKYNRC